MSTPIQPIQQNAAALQQPNAPDTENLPDDESAVSGEPVNIQRAYSKLNSAIAEMCDSLGVRRSATCPHQEGQSMADHIGDVGQVLQTIGGVSANLLVATHTKHSATGGETVAYPAAKLRETIIPKDSVESKKAIAACRSFVSKVASLVGDDDSIVKIGKSQISMIGKNDGENMSAFDLAAALLSIPGPLIQLVARLHSGTKDGGHAPHLRAPKA
jgi:hypothetical protein